MLLIISQSLDLTLSSRAINGALLDGELGHGIRRCYDTLELLSRLSVITTNADALMDATSASALQRSAAHASGHNVAASEAEVKLYPFYLAFSRQLSRLLVHGQVDPTFPADVR